eukprot:4710778-Amphidinium_carterae.1
MPQGIVEAGIFHASILALTQSAQEGSANLAPELRRRKHEFPLEFSRMAWIKSVSSHDVRYLGTELLTSALLNVHLLRLKVKGHSQQIQFLRALALGQVKLGTKPRVHMHRDHVG